MVKRYISRFGNLPEPPIKSFLPFVDRAENVDQFLAPLQCKSRQQHKLHSRLRSLWLGTQKEVPESLDIPSTFCTWSDVSTSSPIWASLSWQSLHPGSVICDEIYRKGLSRFSSKFEARFVVAVYCNVFLQTVSVDFSFPLKASERKIF